jgi:hypothetical protein
MVRIRTGTVACWVTSGLHHEQERIASHKAAEISFEVRNFKQSNTESPEDVARTLMAGHGYSCITYEFNKIRCWPPKFATAARLARVGTAKKLPRVLSRANVGLQGWRGVCSGMCERGIHLRSALVCLTQTRWGNVGLRGRIQNGLTDVRLSD